MMKTRFIYKQVSSTEIAAVLLDVTQDNPVMGSTTHRAIVDGHWTWVHLEGFNANYPTITPENTESWDSMIVSEGYELVADAEL
jgi:hypothetical protein